MAETAQIRLAELSSSVRTSPDPSAASTSRIEDGDQAALADDGIPTDRRVAEAFDSYPDGGLTAWTQVVCGFLIGCTTNGGIYSWGILQDALFERGVAPSSTLSYIGSTQATLQALFAIPINRFIAAYGPRRVALVGSIVAGLGPILAGSCSTSVPGLIVTEGLLFGTGQALCIISVLLLPSNYFLRRRNLATGLVYAGAGVGGAVFSLIAAALVKAYDIQWAFRILGVIFLAINLPCSWMLKSRSPKMPLRRKEGEERAAIIEWSFFRDARFVLLFIGGGIGIFPLFVPPFFLPLFGTSLGLSAAKSSYLLAGFNLSSALGRISFGLGADALLGSVNSLVLCMLSVSVSTLAIWPIANSVGPLAVFAVVNGFCAGGFFSLMPGVLSTLFGSKNLRVVFGMILTSWIPGYFLGAPLAGFLLQALGGPNAGYEAFRPAIFYSGGTSLVAALLLLAMRLKHRTGWVKV